MIFDKHTPQELLALLEEELAKSQSILACAQKDIDSSKGKVGLLIALTHHLKTRFGDKK